MCFKGNDPGCVARVISSIRHDDFCMLQYSEVISQCQIAKKAVIVKKPYMLLTASIALGLGLSACTPSATSPSEQEASQSASASEAAEEQNLSDQQKAANSAIKYSEGVRDKDSNKICNNSSAVLIEMVAAASSTQDCPAAVERIFQQQGQSDNISGSMDRDTIASQASKISDTVYSFPTELFSETTGSNIFVESFDGNWKVTLDPASTDAVKQIESSLPESGK